MSITRVSIQWLLCTATLTHAQSHNKYTRSYQAQPVCPELRGYRPLEGEEALHHLDHNTQWHHMSIAREQRMISTTQQQQQQQQSPTGLLRAYAN